MNYLKTVFTLTAEDETSLQAARDLLADELGNYGYEAFEETPDGNLVGYIQQELYHEAVVKEVINNRLMSDVDITFSTEEIENQDWNAAWEEEGFEPIVVKNMITIYDARHTDDSSQFSTPLNIGIHATNAFGTGTHETTRMMVETLLELPLSGKCVLDCGCGTGILGIAALKCGAKHVVSYDIDEWSAENTRYNAELNGVSPQMDILHGDVHILTHVEGIFDVIVANINRNILLDDMEHFYNVLAKGGTLAISGFYEDDAPLLLEKAKALGLNEVKRKTDNNWCTLIFQTACAL